MNQSVIDNLMGLIRFSWSLSVSLKLEIIGQLNLLLGLVESYYINLLRLQGNYLGKSICISHLAVWNKSFSWIRSDGFLFDLFPRDFVTFSDICL